MIRAEGYARPVPAVAHNHCIGCGACEFLCPSRPISAIIVDGLSVHREAAPHRGTHGGEGSQGEGRGMRQQRRRQGQN